MTLMYAEDDDIDTFLERLLIERDRLKGQQVQGEFTVGDRVCTIVCRPSSTKNSLLNDYYSWLRRGSLSKDC